MTHAYATGNAASSLAASAFTWSTGATTDRDALNDGRMSRKCSATSSASSPVDLTIDFGSATALVGFALLNHSLASYSGATVLVTGADDAAMTVNAVTAKAASTVPTSAPAHKDVVLAFPSVTKRYWRLRFAYGSPPFTVQVGEVLALSAFTSLSRRKVYGWGESERYFVNTAESRTGETYSTFLAGPRRSKRLPFVDLSASEKAEVMAMWRASKGGATNLLFVEDYNSTASAAASTEMECLFGKLKPAMGWTEGDYSLFSPEALELTELGREVGA